MSRRGIACVLLALIGAALAPRRALAQASLGWAAPGECPTGQQVGARVADLLGYGLDQHDQRVDFDGEVSASSDGVWHLVLRIRRGQHTTVRRIDGETCHAVAGAAAAAIALTLKPSRPAEEPATEREPAAASDEPRKEPGARGSQAGPRAKRGASDVRDRAPAAPAPAEPSAGLVRGSARITAGADLAAFGRPVFAAELSLGLLVGQRGRAEAFGRLLPTQRVAVDHGAEADFLGIGGGARGCYQPLTGDVGVLSCLGFEFSRITASGQEITRTERAGVTWMGPVVTAVGLWHLADDVALAAAAEVAAPLVRHKFEVTGLGVVHELPLATGRLGIGVEITMP